jgi:hypothetical protein
MHILIEKKILMLIIAIRIVRGMEIENGNGNILGRREKGVV